MPGKSQSHTDAVLNVLRGTNLIAPASVYVGLFSTAPTDDGSTGTELSGNGYTRQQVTFGAPAADTGNLRKVSNTNVITFGPATADWLQAVAFGVWDAATNGNLLYWDSLTTAKTVQNGDSAQFGIGALVVKED
ncbi:MAG: hypothetical protein HYX72_13590 [Acidobacteria bacterium]|nr:hypothetical protein [Acidobacteriota bacterium]